MHTYKTHFVKTLLSSFILITACSGSVKDKSSNQMTFVVRNMNNETLEKVYIKTDDWHSDTIDILANSDGVIYRDQTSGKFHEGYSIVFGNAQHNYGYEEYTTTIPVSESFMFSFHGDTVRIAAFHIN